MALVTVKHFQDGCGESSKLEPFCSFFYVLIFVVVIAAEEKMKLALHWEVMSITNLRHPIMKIHTMIMLPISL